MYVRVHRINYYVYGKSLSLTKKSFYCITDSHKCTKCFCACERKRFISIISVIVGGYSTRIYIERGFSSLSTLSQHRHTWATLT